MDLSFEMGSDFYGEVVSRFEIVGVVRTETIAKRNEGMIRAIGSVISVVQKAMTCIHTCSGASQIL